MTKDQRFIYELVKTIEANTNESISTHTHYQARKHRKTRKLSSQVLPFRFEYIVRSQTRNKRKKMRKRKKKTKSSKKLEKTMHEIKTLKAIMFCSRL